DVFARVACFAIEILPGTTAADCRAPVRTLSRVSGPRPGAVTPEVVVSPELARELVGTQFPELAGASAELLGAGLDNTAYAIGGRGRRARRRRRSGAQARSRLPRAADARRTRGAARGRRQRARGRPLRPRGRRGAVRARGGAGARPRRPVRAAPPRRRRAAR